MVIVGPVMKTSIEIMLKQAAYMFLQMLIPKTVAICGIATMAISRVEKAV